MVPLAAAVLVYNSAAVTDSDPYNVIAVYVLQLYEFVLLCSEL